MIAAGSFPTRAWTDIDGGEHSWLEVLRCSWRPALGSLAYSPSYLNDPLPRSALFDAGGAERGGRGLVAPRQHPGRHTAVQTRSRVPDEPATK